MLKGIDVSQYQGNVDWHTVKQLDLDFVVLRSTICLHNYRNNDYKDWQFEVNYQQATNVRQRGLETYHVVTPQVPAYEQYEWLTSALNGKSAIGHVWLDVERRDNASPQQIADNVFGLLDRIEDHWPVGIYTGAWFWNPNVARSNQWQLYSLWTASYTETPRIPLDWVHWHTWQYTNQGDVPGIQGDVDLNWRQGKPEPKIYVTLEADSTVVDSLGIDAIQTQLGQRKTVELIDAWVRDNGKWVKWNR